MVTAAVCNVHIRDQFSYLKDAPSLSTITLTGGQIAFPAAQAASADANTLDDYEEGTWTPTLNANLTLNAAQVVQNYIKVGKLVTMFIYFTVNTVSGSDNVTLSLPFTAANAPANGLNRSTVAVFAVNVDTGDVGLFANIISGATTIVFYKANDNAADVQLTNADLAAGDTMGFTMSYMASA